MKIGLLIDSMIGGGAERVVLNLAEGFRRKGHEPHLILVRNEIQHQLPRWLPVHALSRDDEHSTGHVFHKLLLAWRLHSLVKHLETDGKRFAFFISNAEDADRLSLFAGLEHVYVRYRNSMVEYFQSKIGHKTGIKRLFQSLKWRIRFRLEYSGRHLVTVSEALQNELTHDMGILPASMLTIYNPFDFERIRRLGKALPGPLDAPYIVYAAKFERRKRQDVLLEAFARSQARESHKLVLIGDTYTDSDRSWFEQMQALIASLGLQSKVLLPGFQQNPYPWIRHADLFAMSSDSEGLPTVLIESLILGTPVVSTDCPTGPSEILTGKLASFLCPRNRPDMLADRIDAALTSYPEISPAILQRFNADYAIDRYLQHCAGPQPNKREYKPSRHAPLTNSFKTPV